MHLNLAQFIMCTIYFLPRQLYLGQPAQFSLFITLSIYIAVYLLKTLVN